jgi:hypothetical protein
MIPALAISHGHGAIGVSPAWLFHVPLRLLPAALSLSAAASNGCARGLIADTNRPIAVFSTTYWGMSC